MARDQAGRVRPGLRGRGPRARARAARALRPQRELHGVAQAAPGRRRLPRPARRAGPAPGARRGARRGQARRALARRQPARPAPRRPRPRRSATTSCAPTTSATATTRSGLRCPRGAHVRRTNPRDALGWEGRLTARHRILRRGHALRPGAARRRRGRRRGRAGCSSSACRPRSRASSRSSSRSGATTATRSAWAARPTRSRALPAARCATSSRATRRTWSRRCAATSSAAAASTSSFRPSAPCGRCPRSDAAGHKAPARDEWTHRRGWNALEHRSTPSHALGSDPPLESQLP